MSARSRVYIAMIRARCHSMMPELLVVQNTKSKINEVSGKGYTVSYSLSKPIEFKEESFARLVSLSGTKDVALVNADFVRRQEVNGVLEPYLGCSVGYPNSWVPLANNCIPSFGLLQIHHHNFTPILAGRKITIVIEIASKSWINGTKSSTRV